ncbi:hypothetical protein ONO12_26795, partial [Salmonella enterica subsp. enterica serovar Montevideo]|nr:hypothetical protein [Salmonella enterica subsp. enterica serovar Montevideo]
LEALNLTTGETVNFSSREDDHAILIYKLEPTTGMLRTRAYIGPIRSGTIKSYTITEQGDEQITGFHLAGDLVGFDAIGSGHHPS